MSTINANSSGIVITGDTSGTLDLATGGTTRMTVTSGGNLNFAQTGQRITGDFSNATIANRLMFQTSTTNGATQLRVIPNGTGTTGSIQAGNNNDPANQSVAALNVDSSEVRLASQINGTGSYLPMTFYTGGSERVRIDTSGNVGIGGTAGGDTKLDVLGTLPTSGGVTRTARLRGTIPSGTTTAAVGFQSSLATQAASFTLSDHFYFLAAQGTIGAGSTVTNQYGFLAESTLTGATNNYGFFSNIASGSNRWNFYAAGTAQNYFAGNVGIGTTSPSALLTVSKSASTSIDDYSGHFIVSGSTTNAGRFIWSQNSTYALAVALNSTGSTSGNAVFQWITRSTGVLESSPLTLSVNGNIGISGTSFGSGVLVMFIANATTVPSTNPTGGGILYVENGALKYRGSSGTVTTIANA